MLHYVLQKAMECGALLSVIERNIMYSTLIHKVVERRIRQRNKADMLHYVLQEVVERFSQQERRLKEQEALIEELHRKQQKGRRESIESADYHHAKVTIVPASQRPYFLDVSKVHLP